MQEITGAHPKDITDALQTLVREGFLEQQNQRRWASYRVVGDSPHNGSDSPHKAGDSPHKAPDSPHSAEDAPQSERSLASFGLELLKLAEPALRRQRLPPEEMRVVIMAVCDGRWMTAKDLGALLQRDPENLQNRFLTAMVREGTLELRYPGVPNRPDQAYRTQRKT